jgi:hypothetical protein
MNSEVRLAQLEDALKQVFGCYTRFLNDVWEQHGTTATFEERVAVAEKVLAIGPLGIAAHQYECLRRDDLGRPKER